MSPCKGFRLVSMMPETYIIRAEIDVTYKKPGMSAEDWFGCGINRKSEGYPSADAALIAARAAYNGPDVHGIGCWVWAKRARDWPFWECS